MKKILIALIMLMTCSVIQAQKISHIETTSSWNYVYDENGKKVYTFSTSQGEVVAYSESFYILKKSGWYYTCNAKGKRLHTFSVSNAGSTLGTRTARNWPPAAPRIRRANQDNNC